MLPETIKDTLIDSLIDAFPSKRILRDWNDFRRDDTDLVHFVAFGGTIKLFGTSIGNYIGPLEENPTYSKYAYGEVIPITVIGIKLEADDEDTRAVVQTSLNELEIFIKREWDNIFNNVAVDPYSFLFDENVEIGAKTHRIMKLDFRIIYTNVWNDMPPENPKGSYDVKEVRVYGVGQRIWVKL